MRKWIIAVIETIRKPNTKIEDFWDEIKDKEKVMYEFVFRPEDSDHYIVFAVMCELWNKDEFVVLSDKFEQSESPEDFQEILESIECKFFIREKPVEFDV